MVDKLSKSELVKLKWLGDKHPEEEGDYWFEGERWDADKREWRKVYQTKFRLVKHDTFWMAHEPSLNIPVSMLRGYWWSEGPIE